MLLAVPARQEGRQVPKRWHASCATKKGIKAQVEVPTPRTSNTTDQVQCKELSRMCENVTIDSPTHLSPRLHLLQKWTSTTSYGGEPGGISDLQLLQQLPSGGHGSGPISISLFSCHCFFSFPVSFVPAVFLLSSSCNYIMFQLLQLRTLFILCPHIFLVEFSTRSLSLGAAFTGIEHVHTGGAAFKRGRVSSALPQASLTLQSPVGSPVTDCTAFFVHPALGSTPET